MRTRLAGEAAVMAGFAPLAVCGCPSDAPAEGGAAASRRVDWTRGARPDGGEPAFVLIDGEGRSGGDLAPGVEVCAP